MNYTQKELEKAILLAKIMDTNLVFLSTLACSLKTVISHDLPTAGTNGIDLLINPDFFMSLNKGEQKFLIAHETLHVAYMHMVRRGSKNPTKFNYAGDFVINSDLKEQGFELIEGALYDPQYKGLSTEEVYELLPDSEMPNAIGDDIIENSDNINQIQQEIQDKIIKASTTAQIANQTGSIPQSIQRYLADLAKPKVNWLVVLKRFMQDVSKADYTWRKPNRRFLPHGYYLPTIQSENLTKITFAIDTSGSITEKQFNQFLSEVFAVFKAFKPNEIELIQFDHQLQAVDKIKSLHDLKTVRFLGHGGTQPDVALEHFNQSNSKALFVITDGEFYEPKVKVNKPLAWVVFDNEEFTCKQGKVIHFKVNI